MPSADDIRIYLSGVWQMMMTAEPDGLEKLDLSADGFWNSFWAVPLALPALLVNWTTLAIALEEQGIAASRATAVLLLGLVDLATWLLPLLVLALIARPIGLGARFVHYVVSGNWGGLLLIWLMLPPVLLSLVFPAAGPLSDLISTILFVTALVLTWRLTRAAIDRNWTYTTALFTGMLVAAILIAYGGQVFFGLFSQS